MAGKSDQAFRTIGEVSEELGIPQHILRYWETRFPQLKPLQRAGNRRYYRPDDVALARRIHRLLDQEGYTIRGVQQVLGQKSAPEPKPHPAPPVLQSEPASPSGGAEDSFSQEALRAVRAALAEALADTRA